MNVEEPTLDQHVPGLLPSLSLLLLPPFLFFFFFAASFGSDKGGAALPLLTLLLEVVCKRGKVFLSPHVPSTCELSDVLPDTSFQWPTRTFMTVFFSALSAIPLKESNAVSGAVAFPLKLQNSPFLPSRYTLRFPAVVFRPISRVPLFGCFLPVFHICLDPFSQTLFEVHEEALLPATSRNA